MQRGLLAFLGPLRRSDDLRSHLRRRADGRGLSAAGEDVEEWVRRQYVVDGWVQGNLQIDPQSLTPTPTARGSPRN